MSTSTAVVLCLIIVKCCMLGTLSFFASGPRLVVYGDPPHCRLLLVGHDGGPATLSQHNCLRYVVWNNCNFDFYSNIRICWITPIIRKCALVAAINIKISNSNS